MKLTISTASHRGRVRQKNEDNFYANGLSLPQQNDGLAPQSMLCSSAKARLFGVFDGMGGYAAGERASFLAVQAASELVEANIETAAAPELLLDICKLANERVCEEMLNGVHDRIGTTASMLHFYRDTYTVCNVGDSPIFLLRNGELLQLHEEHTERANYERISGKPAPPNKKFRLTQNIGIFTDEMLIEPYCASDKMQDGDQFLICSDGLTDMVSAQTICEVLAGTQSTQEKVDTLLHLALENGGKDNITIVLLSARTAPPRKAKKRKFPTLAVLIATVVLLAAIAVGVFLGIRAAREPAPTEPTQTTESQSTEPSVNI